MNEATVVRSIISGLRARLPGAVIFKHADLVTAGIPDISVTYDGQTTWLEVKLLKSWKEPASALKKKFNALQLATMRLLSQQGKAYYVVAFVDKVEKHLGFYPPAGIAGFLAGETYPGGYYSSTYDQTLNELATRLRR